MQAVMREGKVVFCERDHLRALHLGDCQAPKLLQRYWSDSFIQVFIKQVSILLVCTFFLLLSSGAS